MQLFDYFWNALPVYNNNNLQILFFEWQNQSVTWNEHISVSSTDIMPPALSNSPQ